MCAGVRFPTPADLHWYLHRMQGPQRQVEQLVRIVMISDQTFQLSWMQCCDFHTWQWHTLNSYPPFLTSVGCMAGPKLSHFFPDRSECTGNTGATCPSGTPTPPTGSTCSSSGICMVGGVTFCFNSRAGAACLEHAPGMQLVATNPSFFFLGPHVCTVRLQPARTWAPQQNWHISNPVSPLILALHFSQCPPPSGSTPATCNKGCLCQTGYECNHSGKCVPKSQMCK